jgi:hypothetical protein
MEPLPGMRERRLSCRKIAGHPKPEAEVRQVRRDVVRRVVTKPKLKRRKK